MKEIEREYDIHYYELDEDKKLTIKGLMNFLEDLFLYQSAVNGFGFDYGNKNNLSWVISQWDININNYPNYGDKIKIKSCPVSFRKFFLWQRYEIFNNNERIGSALSAWIAVDTKERRATNITDDYKKAFDLNSENEKVTKMNKIDKIERVDSVKKVSVTHSDIDTNSHVNNVTYLLWAFEVMPDYIIDEYVIKNLKIKYVKESRYGDNMLSKVQVIKEMHNIKSIHEMVNEEGEIITNIEIEWMKK